MNIVVLDGKVLNPGDLSWKGFEKFGQVKVYDRTEDKDVVDRIQDAQVVITNKTVFTKDIMDACPNIKYIGVIATGYNVVDVDYARKKGIVVTNVPGYGTAAVAQFTFALMLELYNQVGVHSESVAKGGWTACPDFSYWLMPLRDLAGKTLGILGYGNIGRKVAEIGKAFGMNILVKSRTKKDSSVPVTWVSEEELFAKSDVITLHCPLTEENSGIINEKTISLMKKNAILINTARGGLVVEKDLVNALNDGRISGAALDVISSEPMAEDSPLYGTKNLIVTPHIAWASHEARARLMEIAVQNLKSFLEGNPENQV